MFFYWIKACGFTYAINGKWKGVEVGGRDGSEGSYTESCRRICSGQELARDVTNCVMTYTNK